MAIRDIVQAAAGQGGGEQLYVEDVFSTYLYTGNGSTQTITNGIDLAGEGGMVWSKARNAAGNHLLVDTIRGFSSELYSNLSNAANSGSDYTSWNANGYSLGYSTGNENLSGRIYASWTFRKAPKFFDVVTYTGDGANTRVLSHSLGSVPGCMIIKVTSTTNNWYVYHRSLTSADYSLALNLTSAEQAGSGYTGATPTAPTATEFTIGGNSANVSGNTYVAYLFAHDAGGFGDSGEENVISCGSFVANSGWSVNLGWEPQWLLVKASSSTGNWVLVDNMRGWPVGSNSSRLLPNTSDAEAVTFNQGDITATGFKEPSGGSNPYTSGATYIYIAIRRGPMKTPTSGTEVFMPQAYADGSLGTSNPTNLGASAGFPVDMFMHSMRQDSTFCSNIFDRLRGSNPALITSETSAEDTGEPLNAYSGAFDIMSGVKSAYNNRFYYYTALGRNHIAWMFRRAPGFFDVVCYTASGAGTIVKHNLGVEPELVITKCRSSATSQGWGAYHTFTSTGNTYNYLQSTSSGFFANYGGGSRAFASKPTATQFVTDGQNAIDSSGQTYVAYLFASCPGVSKVGSVTHVEPTTVSCGFAPRFVLIKSTASTGTDDWFVFDSARGITTGNDPYLRLNSTGAEDTPFGAADLIDPTADGFIMNGFGGGSYIYLAIS